jgi:hypothetical protein
VSDLTVEMLTQEKALEMWPRLVPWLEKSIRGNPMTDSDMDVQYIFNAVAADEAVIFAGFEGTAVALVLVIQFHHVGKKLAASIIAMAGRKLRAFASTFWPPVVDWLRANKVDFLDTYVPFNRAMLYMNKFGFDKSCAKVRMTLGVTHG